MPATECYFSGVKSDIQILKERLNKMREYNLACDQTDELKRFMYDIHKEFCSSSKKKPYSNKKTVEPKHI